MGHQAFEAERLMSAQKLPEHQIDSIDLLARSRPKRDGATWGAVSLSLRVTRRGNDVWPRSFAADNSRLGIRRALCSISCCRYPSGKGSSDWLHRF